MERERFVDKIALVTGGANGLGRGMVEQLVKEGAQVAIFDIEDDTMEEVFGGNDHVFCVHCDVRDYDQVQESVQKVIDRYGRIDVLMNNAGICHREPFLECSKEGWLDVMATNLNGEFYVGQAVARTMVELGVKGYIVNTSSNSSRKTIGGITPYCPSKAAVKMLTQVMALELAKYGIHVNAIAPGTSKTRIAPGRSTILSGALRSWRRCPSDATAKFARRSTSRCSWLRKTLRSLRAKPSTTKAVSA